MRQVLRMKKKDNIFSLVLSILTIRTNSQIIHHYHNCMNQVVFRY